MTKPRSHHLLPTLIIAIVLLSQILIPLRYYLGNSPADERFAWRMFSTQQLISARAIRAASTARVPRDQRNLSPPWRDLLRRGIPQVESRFNDWRKRD